MVNLYDEELPKIGKVAFEMNKLWKESARRIDLADLKKTSKILGEWHSRVEDEFYKIGFIVEVDVTPIWAARPPEIRIADRVKKEEFDHEKHRAEIIKSREQGGI